jgi:hypothetical protein
MTWDGGAMAAMDGRAKHGVVVYGVPHGPDLITWMSCWTGVSGYTDGHGRTVSP